MTAHAQPDSESTLIMRRTFAAERMQVFRAWTDPAWLREWFCPADFQVALAEVDLRVGGSYRLGMRDPDGEVHVAHGVYRQIDPPEKLVFTWQWEHGEMGETEIVLDFIEQGAQTELVLTHQRFPSADWRDKHRGGWEGCLTHLAASLPALG